MGNLKEPSNMYDPHTYYPYEYTPYAHQEDLDEIYGDLDPEDFLDIEDLYYQYTNKR